MKRWRLVAAIVYAAAVIVIARQFIAARRESVRRIHVAYRAAKTLPKNHRITEDDLRVPPDLPRRFHKALPAKKDLAGKYLLHEVDAELPITKSNLGAAPLLEPGAGFVAAMFQVTEPVVCASLEPGDRVKLYVKNFGPKPDHEAEVLAVLGSAAPCTAALTVPPDQSDFFLHPRARVIFFERGHR
jgi:hypothetical protein